MLESELRAARKPKKDEPLLKSRNGSPLLWHSGQQNRNDTIGQVWLKLQKRCGFNGGEGYGFKFLRKTASQLIPHRA